MYKKIVELLYANLDVYTISVLLDVSVEQVCEIEEDLFTLEG